MKTNRTAPVDLPTEADLLTKSGSVLLTVPQVARQLQLSPARIYELLAEGAIKSVRIGRSRRILASELEAYIGRLVAQQDVA